MRISDWSSDVCSSDLPARDKAHDFVAATFRTNEIRLSLIKIKERLLISGKLEKPTFLNGPFDGRSLWRKARFPFPLDQFFFVVKGLVANGVPAFIPAEIKVAIGLHRLPDRLPCSDMRGPTFATEPRSEEHTSEL